MKTTERLPAKDTMSSRRPKDRSPAVCITGSSRGLGAALAGVFAQNGFDVILHGRDGCALRPLSGALRAKGVRCCVVQGDLRNKATLSRLLTAIKKNDAAVLINNAAVLCPHLAFEKMTQKNITELLEINLLAAVKLTNLVYPYFLSRGGGTFININSVSGLRPQWRRAVYCSSKWGLRGFESALRLEAEGHNVKILGVYPSRIKTRPNFQDGMNPLEAARKIYKAYASGIRKTLFVDDKPTKKKRGLS